MDEDCRECPSPSVRGAQVRGWEMLKCQGFVKEAYKNAGSNERRMTRRTEQFIPGGVPWLRRKERRKSERVQ